MVCGLLLGCERPSPLFGTSENEEDIAKYEAFSDDEKAAMDAVSGATMSLRDAHGDILGAIEKSLGKRQRDQYHGLPGRIKPHLDK